MTKVGLGSVDRWDVFVKKFEGGRNGWVRVKRFQKKQRKHQDSKSCSNACFVWKIRTFFLAEFIFSAWFIQWLHQFLPDSGQRLVTKPQRGLQIWFLVKESKVRSTVLCPESLPPSKIELTFVEKIGCLEDDHWFISFQNASFSGDIRPLSGEGGIPI